jgi:hypothetical protein
VRIMPEARWTTHEVASGASGINQGGALYMLMQRHAHLMHLSLFISESYDGDIHRAKEDGATPEYLREMRDRVVPWIDYQDEVVEPSADMWARSQKTPNAKSASGTSAPAPASAQPSYDPRDDIGESLRDMWAGK